MVIEAARALRDGDVVFVGIGLPNLACNLAKRLHAPSLQMVYEAGIFGAEPERQALSIGDPCLVAGAASVTSLNEVFLFFLQRGLIDVGFLGGAQVDRHGNLNTTVIGDYSCPTVRLPGSGGASDIATLAKRVFIIGRQTTPHVCGTGGVRDQPGLSPRGAATAGRHRQRTRSSWSPTWACTAFAEDGEMVVTSLHPDVTPDDVRRNTGWDIVIPDGVPHDAGADDRANCACCAKTSIRTATTSRAIAGQ